MMLMKAQNYSTRTQIITSLFAIVATVLMLQSAQASSLLQEGFNYTAGDALGSSGTWSGGNSGMTIGNGNLTYPGLGDLGGNDFSMAWGSAGSIINSFSAVSSGQIYYSFLLNMTTGSGGNSYLTALNPGTTTPGGSSDAVNIYIDSNNSQALRLRTSGQSEFSSGSSPTLSLNTTYLIVLGYDFDTATASLWLNPTPGDAQPTATESITGGGVVTSIANVGFKSQTVAGDFLIDNILIGTTWADVTPTTIVPEPSTLALAGLGIFGLIASMRRRLNR